ncbi:MAG: FecCD family ABC transporter permease [Kiritimatiellia bacterium]
MNRYPANSLVFCGLSLAALAVLIITPALGLDWIPPSTLWRDPESLAAMILREIRIPRTLTAFCVGAALALSGASFQSMFRNPLATPFTLGVASGASLGSAVYIRLGGNWSAWGLNGLNMAAFAGSLLAVTLVYGLTRMRRGFSTATLLLAGVAVSFFFSSLILFIQYASGMAHSFRIIRWMMGSIEVTGYRPLLSLLPFLLAGALILATLYRELNLLTLGDELAAARGVDVNRAKQLVFTAASLLVGGVVAICGPIGFVGMMAPHVCRLLLGSDHRSLLPAAILGGGIFLVLCDTLARTLMAPLEIPVGVITALLGGPFFIWLLLTRDEARG